MGRALSFGSKLWEQSMSEETVIENPKRRGEWAELRFMAEAAQRGLHVSKPWGDSERYDVAVEHNGDFQRIQIKSVLGRKGPPYRCALHTANSAHPTYQRHEVDFFAVYLIRENLWYILPVQVVLDCASRTLQFSPAKKAHRHQPYKEAWHLLQHRRRVGDGAGLAKRAEL